MRTRPRRIAGIAGIAMTVSAALVLTACGGAETGTGTSATRPSGPFTYDDARGKAVSIASTPTTVVAQSSVAAALWDDGYHVAGAYGELTPDANDKLSYQAGAIDLSQIKVIGSTYGEFDTEKYALMNPQLLIDYTFDGKGLWYVPEAQADKILALAPSIAVPGNYKDTDQAIQTFLDLAGKLGADTTSTAITTAKASYDNALADVAAIAATSGLKVAVMSPTTDSLYVANPAYLPELTTLKNHGLDVMTPVNADANVFTQYSWERATDYRDADVILVDARTYDASKADLAKISTWAHLPAVAAGQVYPWYAAAPYSYQSYAKIFQEIASELRNAKKL